MRHPQICAIVCCTLALLACAADYGFGKLPVPTPQRLPVESFPNQFGDWTGGSDMAVDPDVQAKLPSAKIVERDYTDKFGHGFDLTLVTANDDLDIHDPHTCLPDQGWQIDQFYTSNYGSQTANVLKVHQSGEHLTAIYWWTGYYPPKLSDHFWVQDAAKLRAKFVKERLGDSLMVRILSDDSINSQDDVDRFTKAVIPEVEKLTDRGITPL